MFIVSYLVVWPLRKQFFWYIGLREFHCLLYTVLSSYIPCCPLRKFNHLLYIVLSSEKGPSSAIHCFVLSEIFIVCYILSCPLRKFHCLLYIVLSSQKVSVFCSLAPWAPGQDLSDIKFALYSQDNHSTTIFTRQPLYSTWSHHADH